jgi:hypothetical protein
LQFGSDDSSYCCEPSKENTVSDWKQALDKWGTSFKDALNDASKLTVRTFRGKVKATFDANKKEWTVERDANTVMLAMTEISLDGDVDLFIPMDDNGKVDTTLFEYHQKAVKDGIDARAAVIKGIADVLTSIT